jgi:TonB family protein
MTVIARVLTVGLIVIASPVVCRGERPRALTAAELRTKKEQAHQTAFARAIVHPPPQYPRDAQQRKQQGTGIYQVFVTHDTGVVSGVEVLKSAGFEALDHEVLRTFRLWRFAPRCVHWVIISVEFGIDSTGPYFAVEQKKWSISR